MSVSLSRRRVRGLKDAGERALTRGRALALGRGLGGDPVWDGTLNEFSYLNPQLQTGL